MFKDHEIEVTPDFRFKVTGPLFEDKGLEFSSIDDARNAIDKRELALAQQRKAEANVALAALDDSGERVTIKGIHAAQGMLLGVGKSDAVYPDVTWVRDWLIRRASITAELARIDDTLRPYRLRSRRAYGRIKPEEYEQAIKTITAELSVATERAKKKDNENV
jgi:hypothetical protein